MDKAQYKAYLQSPHWLQCRDRALARAGHRCEYQPLIEDGRGKHSWLGDRCECTVYLEVHHLHYNSLGREQDADLQVLCRLHHVQETIAGLRCGLYPACTDALYDQSEAEAMVAAFCEDNPIEDITVEACIDCYWGERRFCDYHQHVYDKVMAE